jgi:hypothetical protein
MGVEGHNVPFDLFTILVVVMELKEQQELFSNFFHGSGLELFFLPSQDLDFLLLWFVVLAKFTDLVLG